MQKGLFIPGVFGLPDSKKYLALKTGILPFHMDIIDFCKLYQKPLSYNGFTFQLKKELEARQPEFIVAHSAGCNFYETVIAENPHYEAPRTILLMPLGNYGASKHGSAIVSGQSRPSDIFEAVKALNLQDGSTTPFFMELARKGQENRKVEFKNNVLAICADQDAYVEPNAVQNLNLHGKINWRCEIADTHRLTRAIPQVCDLIKAFLQL